MNRKGNSRHNAYLSSLPLFLLTSSRGTPPLFLFSLLLAETVWLLWILSHGQMAGSGVPPARTQNKIKPKKSSIFPVLLYFFFTRNRCLVCLPVSVNHGNQASPSSRLVSLFQDALSHLQKHLSESRLIRRQKEHGLLLSSCFFWAVMTLARCTSLARARFRVR